MIMIIINMALGRNHLLIAMTGTSREMSMALPRRSDTSSTTTVGLRSPQASLYSILTCDLR